MSYPCKKCGNCCRNLNLSKLYSDLDRGDGVCKYLLGNLCSIYEVRPIKCRIDEMYKRYFEQTLTKEQFYIMNKKICKILTKKS